MKLKKSKNSRNQKTIDELLEEGSNIECRLFTVYARKLDEITTLLDKEKLDNRDDAINIIKIMVQLPSLIKSYKESKNLIEKKQLTGSIGNKDLSPNDSQLL
jgi:hypothetical protein